MKTLFLIFLAIIIPVNKLEAADINVEKENHDHCFFRIKGGIDSKTPDELIKIIDKTGKCNINNNIAFDSLGGDVLAAIKIGDIIRSKEMTTTVRWGESCASACVIAFLGGVKRIVVGRIGLHRPYPTIYSASIEEARNKRDIINKELTSYFNRMRIPNRLLDEMNAVPPQHIDWIEGFPSSDLLKKLYISGEDTDWADARDSRSAKAFGISLEEYYSRKARTERCYRIRSDTELNKCLTEVMRGVR